MKRFWESNVRCGGEVIGKVASHGRDMPVTTSWMKPSFAADIENFILSDINVPQGDGTTKTYSPNAQSYQYIRNLHKANLGGKWTADEAIRHEVLDR